MDYADLVEVNREVNALPYKADAEQWGQEDFWDDISDSGSGDCDSYAVGKLRRLVKLGWPIQRLRLATCYIESGEYHAVLIASDDEMDWMLDNRQAHPIPVSDLDRLGYRPAQIQGRGQTWVEWRA